jgi:ankyrin repeat protein
LPLQNGDTPLIIAAQDGSIGLMCKLLAMGAKIDTKNHQVQPTHSPFLDPLSRRHLIASSPHKRAATFSALQLSHPLARWRAAALARSAATMPALPIQFANCMPSASDPQRITALQIAASHNHLLAILCLVKQGDDVNAKDAVRALPRLRPRGTSYHPLPSTCECTLNAPPLRKGLAPNCQATFLYPQPSLCPMVIGYLAPHRLKLVDG